MSFNKLAKKKIAYKCDIFVFIKFMYKNRFLNKENNSKMQ